MPLEALLLNPTFWKYLDLTVSAGIRKAFQDADGMTPEELDAEIKILEAKADEHDEWLDQF